MMTTPIAIALAVLVTIASLEAAPDTSKAAGSFTASANTAASTDDQSAWSHVLALYKETHRHKSEEAWPHVVGLFKLTHRLPQADQSSLEVVDNTIQSSKKNEMNEMVAREMNPDRLPAASKPAESQSAWPDVVGLFKETHKKEPSQWSHVLGLFNATRKEEPSKNAWSHVQALFKETLRQEPANDAWSHVVGLFNATRREKAPDAWPHVVELFKTTHKNTARHGHKHSVVKSPLNHVVELFKLTHRGSWL